MRIRRAFLIGPEAIDAARLAGLALGHLFDRGWNPVIHPNAIVPQMRDLVYLDLTRLSYWDRMRLAWARIGAHYWLKPDKEIQCHPSSSVSCSWSQSSSESSSRMAEAA